MTKDDVIQYLALEQHPLEGGYFKRTYESEESVDTKVGKRKLLSSIFYLLTDDYPLGVLHKNKSDIVHYYQLGSPLEYTIIDEAGTLTTHVLGPQLDKGQLLQLTVKGNCWKASRLIEGDFGLISEAVAPGFEYEDNCVATLEDLKHLDDIALAAVRPYIKSPS